MTRAEAHATTTEHQLGDDAEASFAEWLTFQGMVETRAKRAQRRDFVWGKRRPSRNARATFWLTTDY